MSAWPSDDYLIDQLQSGDLDALGVLYERHRACVYRTALFITHDPWAAEDILQDCFLRLHKYVHTIDRSRPLKPWLRRVTTNLAYTRQRHNREYGQSPLDGMEDWLEGPPHHSPEQEVEMDDTRCELVDAISTLNTKQRAVIVLFYLNALDVNEISTLLKCPVGTVKSRLHYGRANLRQQLEVR
jgi:RNA polymerase sigma-70 factor (ECF subfamily)